MKNWLNNSKFCEKTLIEKATNWRFWKIKLNKTTNFVVWFSINKFFNFNSLFFLPWIFFVFWIFYKSLLFLVTVYYQRFDVQIHDWLQMLKIMLPKRNGICFMCLKEPHLSKDCPRRNSTVCLYPDCGGRHNRAFCYLHFKHQSKADILATVPEPEISCAMNPMTQNLTGLLLSRFVTIRNPDDPNYKRKVLVLFDAQILWRMNRIVIQSRAKIDH